jgi:16S rRNA (uracil1498-N3)-methyltransferase
MPRFYLPPSQIQGDHFRLTGPEAHHALQVLRKKVGDEIELFDGRDRAFVGRIEQVLIDTIEGKILSTQAATPTSVEIWLYAALIKGPRWDWLLQKACEVGVDVLVPIETTRTIVHLDGKEISTKLDRWNRIALEATKQCGRSVPMAIHEPQSFADALQKIQPKSLFIFPWEKENKKTIREACIGFNGSHASLWIGPEGGWTEEEAQAAQSAGAIAVTLGKNMLRSETAGIVATALVIQELIRH